ncbi:hypothetical protein BCR34DRAFT_607469 [Clohesyomyces aquaticus]|uniref:AAA+ ATPase domain-containing protein n=1 Tax=Clohesyomyces aquaticus TaxID=1231657 RepID=A0A1Y1YGJ2_9PLEO|nr:hypothetical protein BCR34DRAFT_607469 [Clohesyomyces aquaticus]
MEKAIDDDSLDALRGYSALLRDERAGVNLNQNHLEMDDVEDSHDMSNRQRLPPRARTHRARVDTSYDAQDSDARVYIEARPRRIGGTRDESPQYEHFQYVEHSSNRDTEDKYPKLEYVDDTASSVESISDSWKRRERGGERDGLSSSQNIASQRRRPQLIHKRPEEKRSIPIRTVHSRLPLIQTQREGPSAIKDILDELEALREENERLKKGPEENTPTQPAVLAYTSQVFHQINTTLYLDQPRWDPKEDGSVVLLANNPIRKIEFYLEQHPEIAFAIYKEYNGFPPADRSKIETKDGVYRTPSPSHEFLSLIAPAMLEAVEELVEKIPAFGDYFPYFDADEQLAAPYLFMYYSEPFIAEVLPELELISQNLIKQLQTAINKSHGYEYESARNQAKHGLVARHLLKYLIRPGDVLISNSEKNPKAYIAIGWIEKPEEPLDEDSKYEDYDNVRRKRIPKYGPLSKLPGSKKRTAWFWSVPVWYWAYDGVFSKEEYPLGIVMDIGYEEETVPITSLNIYPLKYAPKETVELLERRGRNFWSMRYRRFVAYMRSEDDKLHNIEDRYMVDTETYQRLRSSGYVRANSRREINSFEMLSDQPPSGNELLVFPVSIMGYSLHHKSWRELYVDRITDVQWNKQAFKDLVAEPDTKELVQALVMKQIATKESTDFVSGKGNGLIILLHGAPGTGKTFTAEGVAEFAEKPLLRVTCGDVGTTAEVVDQRLRAKFELGKVWDCVVLLDEADVFLEERDMKDLNRNALVSVFLRALEYYEGILILTSNRVGTFDEAFKSRIQLALHYENLGPSQRRKIWRNFLNRIQKLTEDGPKADVEDILDHIDDLSKEVMNGREIRNAITIGRQLAQFKEEPFQYKHLKHVIGVGGKFATYLKDLRHGLTDDDIKADFELRLPYATKKHSS